MTIETKCIGLLDCIISCNLGIKLNLDRVKTLYGPGWTMRLYYQLEPSDLQLKEQLCQLACDNDHLDLCNIEKLPGR